MKEHESLTQSSEEADDDRGVPCPSDRRGLHFWSRFPLGACSCWILWPVLWVLSAPLLCATLINSTCLASCRTFKATRGREWLSWHPGIFRHLGRERTNVFGLSASFTGPSEPENESKATNPWPAQSQRAAAHTGALSCPDRLRAGLPAIPSSRHWRGKGDSTH